MLARRRVRGSKNGLGPWRSLEAIVRFLEIQEGGGKRWGKPSTAEGLRDQPRRGGHVGALGKEEEGLSLLRDREMGVCWKSGRQSGCPRVWGCEECGRTYRNLGAMDEIGRSLEGRGRKRLGCCVQNRRSMAPGSYGGVSGTSWANTDPWGSVVSK